MTSYILKENYLWLWKYRKQKEKKKKADAGTKHHYWFRYSLGIFSRRESKPYHQFLERYPNFKAAMERVEVTA